MNKIKNTLLFACLTYFLTTFLFARSAFASSVTLAPSDDAYIDEVLPTVNMGRSTAISVINDHYLTQGLKVSFGALKFNLSSIPTGSTINSAKLRLYSQSCTLASGTTYVTLGVYKVTSANWSESTLTWNNRPLYGSVNISTQVSGSGYKEWTVTNLVRDWKSGALNNYGLYLLSGTNIFNCRFNSKEASSNKPQLVVDYSAPIQVSVINPPIVLTPIVLIDIIKPTITNTLVTNLNSTQTRISWSTNENATSYVDYYRSGQPQTVGIVGNTILTLNHSVALTGLLSGTTYYYRIRTKDAAGNEASTNYTAFTSQGIQVVTFPVLSNISHSLITRNSAKIAWTTDQQTTSYVDYGTSQSDAGLTSTGNENLVTSHTVNLSNLLANKTYYYKVRSANAFGSSTRTPTFKNFTTLASADVTSATISNIHVGNITTNSSKVTWNTNENSTSWVFISKTADDSTSIFDYDSYFGQNNSVLTHSVDLINLSPDTTYSYRVVSVDASANWAASTRKTFKTEESATDAPADPDAGATPVQTVPPVEATPPSATPPALPPVAGSTDVTSTTQDDPVVETPVASPVETPAETLAETPADTVLNYKDAIKAQFAKIIDALPGDQNRIILGVLAVFVLAIVVVGRHVFFNPKVLAGAALVALLTVTPMLISKLRVENDRNLEKAIRETPSLTSVWERQAQVAGASTQK